MDPLPPTEEALAEIASGDPEELRASLRELAAAAAAVVPELVGISLTLVREGLTFTLVASGDLVAGIDATQYLDGGPCVRDEGETSTITTEIPELLRNQTWELFARASLASGVATTLSLPVLDDGEVIGGINLYASALSAFSGHEEQLADVLGASAEGALADADLAFSSSVRAAETPHRLHERHDLLVAARYRETIEDAARRLVGVAERASLPPVTVARLLIDLHTAPPD